MQDTTPACYTNLATGEKSFALFPGTLEGTLSIGDVEIAAKPDARDLAWPRAAWANRALLSHYGTRPTQPPSQGRHDKYSDVATTMIGKTPVLPPRLRTCPEADAHRAACIFDAQFCTRWGLSHGAICDLLMNRYGAIDSSVELPELVEAVMRAPWSGPDLAEARDAEEARAAEEKARQVQRMREARAKAAEKPQTCKVTPGGLRVVLWLMSPNMPARPDQAGFGAFCTRSRDVQLPDGRYLVSSRAGRYAGRQWPRIECAGSPMLTIAGSDEEFEVTLSQREVLSHPLESPREVQGMIEVARRATLDITAKEPVTGRQLRACLDVFERAIDAEMGSLACLHPSSGSNQWAVPELAEVVLALRLPHDVAFDCFSRKVRPAAEALFPDRPWESKAVTRKVRNRGKVTQVTDVRKPISRHPSDLLEESFAAYLEKAARGEGRWLSTGELVPPEESIAGLARSAWGKVLAIFKTEPEVQHAAVVEKLQAVGALPHTLSNAVHEEVRSAMEEQGFEKRLVRDERGARRAYVQVEGGLSEFVDDGGMIE